MRALRTGDDRLWLVAGVVLGLGLLNKPLPAFLAVGLLAGVRSPGRGGCCATRTCGRGAAIALVLWSPWIVWQADNGWPQIDVSREIAAGGSTSSEPWWAIVPFQFLLISPLLAPVWIAGLVRLFRDPGAARRTGSSPGPGWCSRSCSWPPAASPTTSPGCCRCCSRRGRSGGRVARPGPARRCARALLVGALVCSALIGATISLPLLPADHAELVVAMNDDVGETIGWPDLVRHGGGGLPRAARRTRGDPHRNYGEAGAIERFGPARGLPQPYSGHNAYGDWGPPPDGAGAGDHGRPRRRARWRRTLTAAGSRAGSTTATASTTTSRARR